MLTIRHMPIVHRSTGNGTICHSGTFVVTNGTTKYVVPFVRVDGGTISDAKTNLLLFFIQVTLCAAIKCAPPGNGSGSSAFTLEEDQVPPQGEIVLVTQPVHQSSTSMRAPSATRHILDLGSDAFRGHGRTISDAPLNPLLFFIQVRWKHAISCFRSKNRWIIVRPYPAKCLFIIHDAFSVLLIFLAGDVERNPQAYSNWTAASKYAICSRGLDTQSFPKSVRNKRDNENQISRIEQHA